MVECKVELTGRKLVDLHNFCVETGIVFERLERFGGRVFGIVLSFDDDGVFVDGSDIYFRGQ